MVRKSRKGRGHILDDAGLVGQQGRDQDRQGRVLRAADLNGPVERPSAFDDELIHGNVNLPFFTSAAYAGAGGHYLFVRK